MIHTGTRYVIFRVFYPDDTLNRTSEQTKRLPRTKNAGFLIKLLSFHREGPYLHQLKKFSTRYHGRLRSGHPTSATTSAIL